MDIVDDVIRHLGLRSRVAYRLERIGSWKNTFRGGHLLQLHCVLDGTCWCRVSPQATRNRMQNGDVLVLPRGGNVELYESPGEDERTPPRTLSPEAISTATHAGTPRVLILGVDVELAGHDNHPLFTGLPDATLITRAGFVSSGTRRHAGYLIEQTETQESGTESAIIDRLVEILLIQTIKAHYAANGTDNSFMRALQDPAVSRSVAAIHQSPGYNWSLERLAATSGLSRSAFSRRFTELTGVPAMHYLTVWRMHLALEKLKSGYVDQETVAHTVGYLSPSAFQKAFKRVHGFTPAQAATASARPALPRASL